jgi:hypothetical protein
MSVVNDLYVKGNLEVSGTTYSALSENVLVADRFMLLNSELTVGNETGGIAINYNVIASTSSTSFTSSTSVIECGDLTSFTSDVNSDFVLVSGTMENNGLYEILTRTSTQVVIDTTPFASYVSSGSLIDETVASIISVVSVCIIQSSETGNLQTGSASNGNSLTSNIKSVLLSGDSILGSSMNLTSSSNQIVLDSDSANTTTITTQSAPSGSYTYKIPDAGGNTDFVMTTSPQVLTDKLIVSGLTNHADTEPTLTILSKGINTFTPSTERVVTLPSVFTATGYTYKFIILSGVGSIIITPPDGSIVGLSTVTLDNTLQSISLTSVGGLWFINL